MATMRDTPTQKEKRKKANDIWWTRKRRGYRKKLWSGRKTYMRKVHGDL